MKSPVQQNISRAPSTDKDYTADVDTTDNDQDVFASTTASIPSNTSTQSPPLSAHWMTLDGLLSWEIYLGNLKATSANSPSVIEPLLTGGGLSAVLDSLLYEQLYVAYSTDPPEKIAENQVRRCRFATVLFLTPLSGRHACALPFQLLDSSSNTSLRRT